jgi:CHAT domain-containing protein/tetratricopeptide (TPR) repeat protein/WD40 repeat protein
MGQVYAVALSPDGKTVACAGRHNDGQFTYSIFIFDRADGRLLHRFEHLDEVILNLTYSTDGNNLAVTFAGPVGVKVFRLSDYKLVLEDYYEDQSYSADFSSDGRLVTCSRDEKIHLYDARLHLTKEAKAQGGKYPYSCRFSPDATKIAIGYDDKPRVDVLSSTDLTLLYSAKTDDLNQKDSDLRAVTWSSDGRTLFAAGSYNRDKGSFIRKWDDQGKAAPHDLAIDHRDVNSLISTNEGIGYGTADGSVGLIKFDGTAIFSRFSPQLHFLRADTHLLISASGNVIQFPYESDGLSPGLFSLTDRHLQLLPQGATPPLAVPPLTAPIRSGTLSISSADLIENLEINGHKVRFASDQQRYEAEQEEVKQIAIAPDQQTVLVSGSWDLYLFQQDGRVLWRHEAPSTPRATNIAGNGKICIAAFNDGTIRWFDMASGNELASLFPHADQRQWVLWAPSGHFDYSEGSESLIGWHVNNGLDAAADFLSTTGFRQEFRNPQFFTTVLSKSHPPVPLSAELAQTVRPPASPPTGSTPPEETKPSETSPSGTFVLKFLDLLDKDPKRATEFLKNNEKTSRAVARDLMTKSMQLMPLGTSTDPQQKQLALTGIEIFRLAIVMYSTMQDWPDLAYGLMNAAEIFDGIGDLHMAADYWRLASEIAAKSKNSAITGTIAVNWSMFLIKHEEAQQAKEVLQTARKDAESIHDNHALCYISWLQGRACEDLKRKSEAVTYYTQAVLLSRQVKIPDVELRSLRSLGSISLTLTRYDKALYYYRQALQLAERINIPLEVADSHNDIAEVYQTQTKYTEFLAEARKALDTYKKLGLRNKAAQILVFMGMPYDRRGEFQKAREFFEEALKFGSSPSLLAQAHNAIAEAAMNEQDFSSALAHLQEAEKLLLRLKSDPEYNQFLYANLHNKGSVYAEIGDLKTAEAFLAEALDLARSQNDKQHMAATLTALSSILTDEGKYVEAKRYLKEALGIRRTFHDYYGEGATLLNLGALSTSLKDPEESLRYYREALVLSQLHTFRSIEWTCHNNISYLLLDNKSSAYNPREAWKHLQRGLQLSKEMGDKRAQGTILAHMTGYYAAAKQWSAAISKGTEAANLLEEVREQSGGSELREKNQAINAGLYPTMVAACLQAGQGQLAFNYAERGKARTLADLLVQAASGIQQKIDPVLVKQEELVLGQIKSAQKALAEPLSPERHNELETQLEDLERRRANLRETMRSKYPALAELRSPTTVSVREVQDKILHDGEVLLEYAHGDGQFYAFVVGKHSFAIKPLPGSVESLSFKFLPLLQQLHFEHPSTFDRARAYDIYKDIFAPVEDEIQKAAGADGVKTLVIVPDLLFNLLPLEMLVVRPPNPANLQEAGDPTQYLLYKYAIAYAPSASVLRPEIMSRKKNQPYIRDGLALAPFTKTEEVSSTPHAATSTDVNTNALRRAATTMIMRGILPNSADEVEEVSSLYTTFEVKEGAQATKAAWLALAPGSHYLHVSTHAAFDSEDPLYSAVFLYDGPVYAYEIFNLNLSAQHVVLSACDSGLGKLVAGEGLVTLSRAFMYAGVPTTITSLWQVADVSTPRLMDAFYQNLQHPGTSRAEALRQAKLTLFAEDAYQTTEGGESIDFYHPYFWASFILLGDWRPETRQ